MDEMYGISEASKFYARDPNGKKISVFTDKENWKDAVKTQGYDAVDREEAEAELAGKAKAPEKPQAKSKGTKIAADPFAKDTPKKPAPDSKGDRGKPRVHVNPFDDRYGEPEDDDLSPSQKAHTAAADAELDRIDREKLAKGEPLDGTPLFPDDEEPGGEVDDAIYGALEGIADAAERGIGFDHPDVKRMVTDDLEAVKAAGGTPEDLADKFKDDGYTTEEDLDILRQGVQDVFGEELPLDSDELDIPDDRADALDRDDDDPSNSASIDKILSTVWGEDGFEGTDDEIEQAVQLLRDKGIDDKKIRNWLEMEMDASEEDLEYWMESVKPWKNQYNRLFESVGTI
jgi:hypothetical protein